MAFKKKNTTDQKVFCLTLPLRYNNKGRAYLDRMFDACLMTEHHLMSAKLKVLRQMERTKAYRALKSALDENYKKNLKPDEPGYDELLDERIKLLDQLREMCENYRLTAACFEKDVKKHIVFGGMVHSQVKQKLAARVWDSFESYLYNKGKTISFVSRDKFFTICGKSNSTGIRYKDGYFIVGKEKYKLSFNKHDTYGYETEAMKRDVHFCGVMRRWYPEGWRYFAQLYLGGLPPVKLKPETGEILYPLGNGRVGHDIGPQTLASVGDKKAQLVVIAENVNDIHAEIRRIQRKMDRSRRAHNTAFFDEKGCVVHLDKLPKELINRRGKRKWNETNNYKRLVSRRRYLFSKIALQRKQAHCELANRLLGFGSEHYIEQMNWKALAKRRKEDKVNESGKHISKKRFGKSIANRAPAAFEKILSDKLISRGVLLHFIDTTKAKASQYNHMDHTYKKKKLSQRWNYLPNGDKVQRDLYSAFLIQNTNKALDGFVQELLDMKYPNFKTLHDIEIQRLSTIHMPSSAGLKCAA